MLADKEPAAGGDEPNIHGIDDVLRDSHRYSEEIRERDRRDQRQGWIWFLLLVVMAGLIAGFWAWIRP
jgi:fatty acid desaturase